MAKITSNTYSLLQEVEYFKPSKVLKDQIMSEYDQLEKIQVSTDVKVQFWCAKAQNARIDKNYINFVAFVNLASLYPKNELKPETARKYISLLGLAMEQATYIQLKPLLEAVFRDELSNEAWLNYASNLLSSVFDKAFARSKSSATRELISSAIINNYDHLSSENKMKAVVNLYRVKKLAESLNRMIHPPINIPKSQFSLNKFIYTDNGVEEKICYLGVLFSEDQNYIKSDSSERQAVLNHLFDLASQSDKPRFIRHKAELIKYAFEHLSNEPRSDLKRLFGSFKTKDNAVMYDVIKLLGDESRETHGNIRKHR